MSASVKFIQEGDDWFIEGLILPLGGPVSDGNDLTGTHFTKSTDFCLDWFPDGGRPGLYAHGFDATLGTSVIGREVKSWDDDKGRWMRAQIDKRAEYAAEVKQLVEEGHLSLSSGAVDHLVRIDKTGAIKAWPWVEWSLVPNPANPEAVLYAVKSADAVAHLGVVSAEVPEAIKTEPEPQNVEPVAVKDMGSELLSALLNTLTPQALHDAAMASGATCSGDTYRSAPAPLLAIAGKHAEPAPEVDLDALRSDLSALAVKTARELLR